MLQYVAPDTLNAREVLRAVRSAVNEKTVIGFMLWTMGMGTFNSVRLVEHLAGYGLPVSVLDEVEHCPPDLSSRVPGVRHVRVAFSPHAGLAVGAHLLDLGHRRIAFVTHVPGLLYSKARLEGLRTAVARAGLAPDTIRVVVPGTPHDPDTDVFDNRFLSPPPTVEQLLPSAAPLTTSIEQSDRSRIERHHEAMAPVVDALLLDRSVTAWVCVSDDLALYVLAYLRAAKVRVPEDISVCGFDDTLEATRMRLTSYDFNNYGVVHACLDHILSPGGRFRRPARGKPLEIEGFVVRRQTTGRPRG
jgi:DNA-binding LacI/PurR family transcriptional regulator